MKNEERKLDAEEKKLIGIVIFMRLLLIGTSTGLAIALFIIFGGFSEDMNALSLVICLFVFSLGFMDYNNHE